MRDIGELDVHTSPWELPSASKASESTSRTIQYTHPVNVPMAPPTAKARKQQVLHKFGDAGLCLETCTVVEAVPMADCFVVEDRVWVHGAKDGSEGCSVSVSFQIRFVKSTFFLYSIPSLFLLLVIFEVQFTHTFLGFWVSSSSLFVIGTMFRRVIENMTKKEYEVFWNQFAGLVRGLGKGSQEAAISLKEAPAMLEVKEQKVLLSTILSCFRRLTRRLWIPVIPPSTREVMHLKGMKKTCKINVQIMVTYALGGFRYIRKMSTEVGYALFVACAVLFLMSSSLNIMAMRQMTTMMDARLEQINSNQEILLRLLGNGKVFDGFCSN
jgi:hypothetical protein